MLLIIIAEVERACESAGQLIERLMIQGDREEVLSTKDWTNKTGSIVINNEIKLRP